MSTAALVLHSVLLGGAVVIASFIVGWSVMKGANKLAEAAALRAPMEARAPAPLPPIHITVAAPAPPPPSPETEESAAEPAAYPEQAENREPEAAADETERAIAPLPEIESLLADDRGREPGEESS